MCSLAAPNFVRAILEWPWTWPLARFALVVTFLASGLSKIANLSGGVTEMAEAGMLGGFTGLGAVTAHAFWKVSGPERKEAIAVFLMHFGLIAALALDALLAERVVGQ
jgi:uncharacterized membrane protein YphA (DoxX/SURF4 family)